MEGPVRTQRLRYRSCRQGSESRKEQKDESSYRREASSPLGTLVTMKRSSPIPDDIQELHQIQPRSGKYKHRQTAQQYHIAAS